MSSSAPASSEAQILSSVSVAAVEVASVEDAQRIAASFAVDRQDQVAVSSSSSLPTFSSSSSSESKYFSSSGPSSSVSSSSFFQPHTHTFGQGGRETAFASDQGDAEEELRAQLKATKIIMMRSLVAAKKEKDPVKRKQASQEYAEAKSTCAEIQQVLDYCCEQDVAGAGYDDDTEDEDGVDTSRLQSSMHFGAGASDAAVGSSASTPWVSHEEAYARSLTLKPPPQAASYMEREVKVRDVKEVPVKKESKQVDPVKKETISAIPALEQPAFTLPVKTAQFPAAPTSPTPVFTSIPTRVIKFPPKEYLPSFIQGVTDLSKFFKESEAAYSLYDLPDDRKVHCLYFQLPEGPRSYVQDCLFGKTWTEAKRMFKERYGDIDALAEAGDKFERCFQADYVTVAAFLTEFEAKASAANKTLGGLEIAQTFLRRLKQDIRRGVQLALGLRDHYTLQEVFRLALHTEKLLPQSSRKTSYLTRQDRASPDAHKTRSLEQAKLITCHYCGKLGHRQTECRKKLSDANAATSATAFAPRTPAEAKSAGSTTDLSKVTCYSCNKQGHYSKDCPSKSRSAKAGGNKGDRRLRRVVKLGSDTEEDEDEDIKADESPSDEEEAKSTFEREVLLSHDTNLQVGFDEPPDLLSDSDDDDADVVHVPGASQSLLRTPAVTSTLTTLHQVAGDAEEQGRPVPQVLEYADDIVVVGEFPAIMEDLRRLQRDQNPAPDIIAPVLLNGQEVGGVVDSGAQTSIVSQAFCERMQLTIKPAKEGSRLRLADESSIPRLGTALVTIKTQETSVEAEMEVMYLKDSDLIIGLDLFAHLRISIQGVPSAFPSQGREEKLELKSYDVDPQRLADNVDAYVQTVWDPQDSVELLPPLQVSAAYQDNVDLPSDAFATGADAVLSLDTGDADPVFTPSYPCPDKLLPLVDARIKEDMDRGVIAKAPRNSPWNSPLCVVLKKDANGRINPDAPSVRVCIDTRRLNGLMKNRTLRVPLIIDLFKRLQGFKIASALDLKDGYYNIKIAEEDQIKLTFTWRGVRYLYRRAPFGLKVMVSFFQGFMETLLEPFLDFCLIYLDDLIIYTVPLLGERLQDTYSRHRTQVVQVLECLTAHCMRINAAKCHFGFIRLRVLGHILTGDSRAVDPEKLACLKRYPTPTSRKQVQAFLGFVNYLRDYIPLYSTLAAPLEALRHSKNVVADWLADPRCQASFDAFLEVLQEAPVLNFPLPDVPFCVHTDASDKGIGAVLSQRVDDKKRYILFVAKSLNPAQRNYSATKRELLAIIFALNYFRDFLYLSHFELYTDHRALTYIFTQKQLSPMMCEWLGTLQDFNFSITHLPGLKNVLADALSRCYPDFVWEEKGVVGQPPPSDRDDIKVASLSVQEAMLTPRTELVEFVRSRMDKRLPKLKERKRLMEQEHAAGHFGAEYLFKKLWSRDVYWPSMKSDCTDLVSSCMQCLRYNIGKSGFHPQHSIQAKYPFDHIAVDNFQMESTSPRGFNYVLVIVDIATRFVLLHALENEKATTIAKRLWECFCTFGVPKVIQSDRGTAFVNKVVSKLTSALGVDHRLIAPYNAKANGAAERHVQTAKSALLKICEGNIINFDLFIPATQYAINIKVSSLHNSTPFSLLFARPVNPLQDYRSTESALMTAEELKERNETMMRVVYPELELKTADVLRKRDAAKDASHRVDADDLAPGTQVMIKDLKRSKAEPFWVGPYQVLSKAGFSSYHLLDSTREELPRIVPRDQMKIIRRPLQSFERQPAFEVDHIINHRVDPKTHTYEYLVSWKRYPDDDSWEPVSSFDDIDPIRRYWGARHAGVEALKSAKRELKSARARTKKRRAEREVAALQAAPSAVLPAAHAALLPAVPVPSAVVPAVSVPSAVVPAVSVPSAVVPAVSVPSAVVPATPSAVASTVYVPAVPSALHVATPSSITASAPAANRPHRSQQAQRAPKRFHYM